MKRTALILIAVVFAFAAFAGEQKPKAPNQHVYNTSREMKSAVFEIHHRDPGAIANSIKLLGSGFQGAGLSVNSDLGTITVRDFPENVATIGAAIKRLDVPAAPKPGIELHLYVLVGSTGATQGGAKLPPELDDVVSQLKATLRYKSYALMTSAVHHTRSGEGIRGSGVAQDKLIGFSAPEGTPVFYAYALRRLELQSSGGRNSIDVDDFRFDMRVPLTMKSETHYQNIGFDTPVTIREGEKVVVGTTTMGDKALVVVVTAKVEK